MTCSWHNIKQSDRSKNPHPLLCFGAELAQISAAHSAELVAAGKGNCISLAVGDPALDGNMTPPPVLLDEMNAQLTSTRANGYTSSTGAIPVREAIVEYWTRWFALSLKGKLSSQDVVLTSGCSDALALLFGAMANPGDRLLIPKPYFAQYDMTAAYYGIEPEYYPCDPAKNWEVDLVTLRHIIETDAAEKKSIRGCLINNPSNPCGSNWSRQHVTDLVALLDELRVPIIADEIYAGMVFDLHNPNAKVQFTSVSDVDSLATRFVLGGASKRFSIPGERFGWIISVDPSGAGQEIMQGVRRLTGRYLIPSSVIQAAMVTALKDTDEDYFRRGIEVVKANAGYLFEALQKIPALQPMEPSGGMFMSILLNVEELSKDVATGVDFAYRLAAEENVHVFPGEPFKMPNAIRLTLSRPMEVTKEAVGRLQSFCARHSS